MASLWPRCRYKPLVHYMCGVTTVILIIITTTTTTIIIGSRVREGHVEKWSMEPRLAILSRPDSSVLPQHYTALTCTPAQARLHLTSQATPPGRPPVGPTRTHQGQGWTARFSLYVKLPCLKGRTSVRALCYSHITPSPMQQPHQTKT